MHTLEASKVFNLVTTLKNFYWTPESNQAEESVAKITSLIPTFIGNPKVIFKALAPKRVWSEALLASYSVLIIANLSVCTFTYPEKGK